MSSPLTLQAAGVPPHYRPGNQERHCGNCGAYDTGFCRMYRVPVTADKVCDKWYPQKGQQK